MPPDPSSPLLGPSEHLPRGVLKAFCIRCLCEWHTDMEEYKPGYWRAVEPSERVNADLCRDCGGLLTMPERIEQAA